MDIAQNKTNKNTEKDEDVPEQLILKKLIYLMICIRLQLDSTGAKASPRILLIPV